MDQYSARAEGTRAGHATRLGLVALLGRGTSRRSGSSVVKIGIYPRPSGSLRVYEDSAPFSGDPRGGTLAW